MMEKTSTFNLPIQIILCFFIITLYGGCKNNNEKAYMDLRFKPSAGDIITFEIEKKREIEQNFKSFTSKSQSKTRIQYTYEVLSDSNNNKIKVLFNSFEFGDSEEENSSKNPFDAAIKAFNGAQFSLIISPCGKVEIKDGYGQFASKLDALHSSVSLNEVDKTPPSKSLFTEDYLERIFEFPFNYWPDYPVGIGDTWTKTELFDGSEPIEIRVVYTLHSVVENIAIIKSIALIEDRFTTKDDYIPIKGKLSGEVKIDTRTGLLLEKFSLLNIEGEVSNFFVSSSDEIRIRSVGKRGVL